MPQKELEVCAVICLWDYSSLLAETATNATGVRCPCHISTSPVIVFYYFQYCRQLFILICYDCTLFAASQFISIIFHNSNRNKSNTTNTPTQANAIGLRNMQKQIYLIETACLYLLEWAHCWFVRWMNWWICVWTAI